MATFQAGAGASDHGIASAVIALRAALEDCPFLPKDDATLSRYIREYRSIELAKERLTIVRNWRLKNNIDTLIDRWADTTDPHEKIMQQYLPSTILNGRTYDGSVVLFHRVHMVDWAGLSKLKMVNAAVTMRTYLYELSLRLDPRGQALMIVDCGYSEEEEARGTAVVHGASIVDFVAFLRALASIVIPYYPQLWRRVHVVRCPTYARKVSPPATKPPRPRPGLPRLPAPLPSCGLPPPLHHRRACAHSPDSHLPPSKLIHPLTPYLHAYG